MAGEAYAKFYGGGGFVDSPSTATPVTAAFINAVETALVRLLGADPLADGVPVWDAGLGRFKFIKLTNAQVDAAAAIDKSKLAALSITNSDVAGAAGIDGSKLADGISVAKLSAGSEGQIVKTVAGVSTWSTGATPALDYYFARQTSNLADPASYTDIPGVTVTLVNAGTYVIFGDVWANASPTSTMNARLLVDGADQGAYIIADYAGTGQDDIKSHGMWVVTTAGANKVAKLQGIRTGTVTFTTPYGTILALRVA
jgi:hypothetical protein